jgi:hypothetical protein
VRVLRWLEQTLLALARGRDTPPLDALLGLIAGAGALHGLSMGSFQCVSWARARLILYDGVKVPLLLLGTASLCLPGFVIANAALGFGGAIRRALAAILAGQAGVALSLCSLSPIVLLFYSSGVDHRWALLTNGVVFACAAAAGQWVIRRHYETLVAEDPRHQYLLWAWVASYVFVGIQMGWLLRPFVGDPDKPVSFLRPEPLSNAYVVVLDLLRYP